jgi:hypothetical protein
MMGPDLSRLTALKNLQTLDISGVWNLPYILKELKQSMPAVVIRR